MLAERSRERRWVLGGGVTGAGAGGREQEREGAGEGGGKRERSGVGRWVCGCEWK